MKMSDNNILNRFCDMSLPTSFRVIGIGEATKGIIETVKSYGYLHQGSNGLLCCCTNDLQILTLI